MKQLSTKCKIICAIIAVLIIAGIAVVALMGFNIDLKNKNTQTIQLKIGKTFEIQDIKQMTNEVFAGKQVMIQKVEVYDDAVLIASTEITDEEKSNIVNKINEKYETELKAEDITIENIPHTELYDIIKPYIVPLVIATSLILVYVGIRFYKIGMIKSIIKMGAILVIAEVLLFAVMAIARIPVGSLTLPLVLYVYLITALGVTIDLEKALKQKKLEEAN